MKKPYVVTDGYLCDRIRWFTDLEYLRACEDARRATCGNWTWAPLTLRRLVKRLFDR